MKKSTLSALLLCAGVMAVPAVHAADHSVSAGYAQSKVRDFKDIRGVNVKYRYEGGIPVGLITSFSYMKGERNYSESWEGEHLRGKEDTRYWSLLAGPALRVSDLVSVYALAGAGSAKSEIKEAGMGGASKTKTGFAWGAGVQFNPVKNVVIDVGYEGSRVSSVAINGFNVGVGYRF
ncbi:Ail/Lom family outer membrane beta-barrel protein [Salmonella enterica]|nr:hypothetical protein [Salmonella enterica]EBL7773652.1 hypothetical protein [Salmonella enterica]EHB8454722.1 Ail/Lom family outer membrane beta-barrel protein [Salmonella enterica]HBM0065105.1 Ail/Lom family outer membrane beta-barrel protein [Salmonella enterica subsp. enterica serovar Enteritidis]